MKNSGSIPGPSRGIDGISRMPGRALVRYVNWQEVKRQFLANEEYTMPRPFLANVLMWDPKQINSGQANKMIAGWAKDKANFEQKKTEYLMAELLKQQRNNMPAMLNAKLSIVAGIIKDVGKWDRLDAKEKKLCYDILKTEMGEPTSIKTVGIITPKDPVEALLEEYGMMKDGRIIIDVEPNEGSSDSEAAPAIDGGPSAETSQD